MDKFKIFLNLFLSVSMLLTSVFLFEAKRAKLAQAQACVPLAPGLSYGNNSIDKGSNWDPGGPPPGFLGGSQCNDSGPINYKRISGGKHDVCFLGGIRFYGETGLDSARAAVIQEPNGDWSYLGQSCDGRGNIYWTCLDWK
jgi:hypothetical protein